jgi:putative Holliday junction resolvase
LGRIIAIDYGLKRTGIAVTDICQLIANPLKTIKTHELMDFLTNYIKQETIDCIVVGEAKTLQNKSSQSSLFIEPFVKNLQKKFSTIPVERIDERFTSTIALQTIRNMGLNKKRRQDKSLVDTVSATLILQSYLELKNNNKQILLQK